jgi:excisionase family DNA binding protein
MLENNSAHSHRAAAPTMGVVAPGSVTSIGRSASLLSIREVASELGVSVRTVHRLIKARKLSSIKLDGILKFRPSDVEHFLERRLRRAA